MKLYNKFKWVCSFCLLSLFSTLSKAQVREGGWLSEGGNFLKNANNPWFIEDGNEVVKYCIKYDSGQMSLSLDDIRFSVNEAISFWQRDLIMAKWKDEKVIFALNMNFQERSCSTDTDLVFNLGTLSDAEKKYIPEPKSIVALTVRTQYDEEKLKGRGFIYISPDKSLSENRANDLPVNTWSAKEEGLLLTLVLQHELGHVLGIQHGNVQGDVMQFMSADFVENLLLRGGSNEITSNNISFFYTPYNLEEGSTTIFNHRVMKKESCDLKTWDALLLKFLKLPNTWTGCIKISLFKGNFNIEVKSSMNDGVEWQRVGQTFRDSRPKILSYENVITLYVSWDKQKIFPQEYRSVGNYLPLPRKRVYSTIDTKFIYSKTQHANPVTVSNVGGILTFGGSFKDDAGNIQHIISFDVRK